MSQQLESAVVRMRTTNAEVVGAGFLVDERHILTCVHVVAAALGLPEDTQEMPEDKVHLDFPLLAPGHVLTARAIHWQHKSDVAGLQLDGDLPTGARPVRLVTAQDLWAHAFRAFGFPSGYEDGVWASGVLRGRTAAGWVQIEDVKEPGYWVQPGFSGTAVWDEQLHGVVGMAVAADVHREIKAAFMIPADVLIEAWPQLAQRSLDAGSLEYLRERSKPHLVLGTAPPKPVLLVGREGDLAELRQRLTGKTDMTLLTAVCGWPGVGKTTLAAALAHDPQLCEEFTDGVLWAALGPKPNLLQLLGEWMTALGHAPRPYTTTEGRSARLTKLLQDRRMLLIVDDVWDAVHAHSFCVGGRSCGTLITTREPEVARDLGLPDRAIYRLPVLPVEEALTLLHKLAPDAVATDVAGARHLALELEGLPLALQVAGRLLAAETALGLGIDDLLTELAKGTRILQEKAPANLSDVTNQTTPTVAVLFQKSTDRLDTVTRDRFALLGAFVPKPATFSAAAAAEAWDVDNPRPTLRTLVDRGLLEPAAKKGRFQMHALLAVHARAMCEESEANHAKSSEANERLARYYLGVARAVEKNQDFESFNDDWDQALNSLEHAANRSDEDGMHLFSDLTHTLSGHFDMRGMTHEWARWCLQAAEVCAVTGRRKDEGIHRSNLGEAYRLQGEIGEAITQYRKAIPLLHEAMSWAELALAYNKLAIAYQEIERSHEARDWAEKGLEIATVHDDPNCLYAEAQLRVTLCVVLRRLPEEPTEQTQIWRREQIERAIEIYQKLNRKSDLAWAYHNAADLETDTPYGNLYAARKKAGKAITLHQEVGNIHGKGWSLAVLGAVHRGLENYKDSVNCYKQAIEIFERIGLPTGVGWAALGASGAYLGMGDGQAVLEFCDKSENAFAQVQERANMPPELEENRQMARELLGKEDIQ